jgi:sec-independent protein translocase protein TatB
MEFFNIGGLELLLILVIALVVLGPDRIVKVGHTLGSWLRKLSKNVLFREVVQTTDEIRNYPRKILDEAHLNPEELDLSKQISFELDTLQKSPQSSGVKQDSPNQDKSEEEINSAGKSTGPFGP